MKTIKENLGSMIVCLFEILVGVLLLINPSGFTSCIFVVVGVALMVLGIINLIQYFRTAPEEASKGQALSKGLILLLVGVFCVLKYQWFIATFPILPILYGIVILIIGLGKIQWSVDALRLSRKNWYLSGISALMSIICAVIILKNPFASITVLWTFTGVGLIVEAVLDIVILVMDAMNKKQA